MTNYTGFGIISMEVQDEGKAHNLKTSDRNSTCSVFELERDVVDFDMRPRPRDKAIPSRRLVRCQKEVWSEKRDCRMWQLRKDEWMYGRI